MYLSHQASVIGILSFKKNYYKHPYSLKTNNVKVIYLFGYKNRNKTKE